LKRSTTAFKVTIGTVLCFAAINEAAAEAGQDVPADEVVGAAAPDDDVELLRNRAIGVPTILSRSFIGSPRYWAAKYYVSQMTMIEPSGCDGIDARLWSADAVHHDDCES